ncbi:hypothetical protein PMAYCL1PPCAC_25452, partial [Pristionchus mayeri]
SEFRQLIVLAGLVFRFATELFFPRFKAMGKMMGTICLAHIFSKNIDEAFITFLQAVVFSYGTDPLPYYLLPLNLWHKIFILFWLIAIPCFSIFFPSLEER